MERVGVHQGSVLSPVLFILSFEALSRELRSAGLGLGLVFIKDQYSVLYCSFCHLKHCRVNSDQQG